MLRTITVKGIGKVNVAPDCVVVSMSLEAKSLDYEMAMRIAAENINDLNEVLEKIGFNKNDLKTSSFDVRTTYESVKDRNGNYKRVFDGYVCSQRLKLQFDFDTKLIAKTLHAISTCLANPQLSISFTVKDTNAVNKELLRSATINAKEKAEVLCDAACVELGDLVSIDYNWGELNVYSRTEYMCEDKCMSMACEGIGDIDIEPEDIKVSDSATFVWEIK